MKQLKMLSKKYCKKALMPMVNLSNFISLPKCQKSSFLRFYNLTFDFSEMSQLEDLNTNRITRILTTDFPQYFAIVSRIRQEVHAIGPEGGVVNSTVVPQVQAVFPQGALTKKIKVGLQVNMFRPRRGVQSGLLKKITVNHLPKKKRFSLIW